jgi:UDP-N-acetylglucosamine 2-epimerase (non-hydrolysing)
LQQHAGIVVTDSGGIQEETSWLEVPCLTLRDNTERPVTISYGTNQLIGSNPKNLSHLIIKNMNSDKNFDRSQLPDFWDGRTGPRIASAILKELK